MRCAKPEEAMKVAETLMSDGVNSPVRAFKSVDTPAIFMNRGGGSEVYDIGGNEYIDYALSREPLILGHRDPQAISHLHEIVSKDTSFGASALLENKLAQFVIDRAPSIERARMVSSGTEVTLDILRLARGYTGRNKVVKSEGCYHGHGGSLLTKAGLGMATLGLPDSPGASEGIVKNTITVPHNDLDALKTAFEEFRDDTAGVIVEPIADDMGVVPLTEGFLQGLRDITTGYDALLISDEVMTGFRAGYRCVQGHFGVTSDLTCLGKVISEGLPVGAFGGKEEIMDHTASLGNIYQVGTLSGNSLAATSGYKMLSQLTPEIYEYFNMLGGIPKDGLKCVFAKHNILITVNRTGPAIGYLLNEEPVTNFGQASKSDLKLFAEMYREMTGESAFLPPSQFEDTFLSTAHMKEDIEKTIQVFDTALSHIVK